jgi:hypothetical protein
MLILDGPLADAINAGKNCGEIHAGAELLLAVENETLKFLLDASGWRAQVADDPPQVDVVLLSPEPVKVKIGWYWEGKCVDYYSVGADEQPIRFPQGLESRYANRPAGIIMSETPPQSLSVNGAWRLQAREGLYYDFEKMDGQKVTVRELVDAVRARELSFTANAMRVKVEQVKGTKWPARLQANINNHRLLSSVEEGHPVWEFGPVRFLAIGCPGAREGEIKVYRVDSEKKVSEQINRDLIAARLPTSWKRDSSDVQPFLIDGGASGHGIYVSTLDVPKGKWKSFDPGSAAERIVSWRGLVDKAQLLSVEGSSGGARRLLWLDTGFELKSERWFVAPFAGIAMHPQGSWWADLESFDESFLTYSKENGWTIYGQWLQIRLPGKGDTCARTETNAACIIEDVSESLDLVLSGKHTDPESISGPILRLQKKCATPTLRGWISDMKGDVHLGSATIGLSTAAERRTFSPGTSPPPDTPPAFLAALKEALAQPRQPIGIVGNLRWRRKHNQEIEIWFDPDVSGVHEFSQAR